MWLNIFLDIECAMIYEIRPISLKDDHLPQSLCASDEFVSRFKGLVIKHLEELDKYPLSNFLVLASPSINSPPIGFHYFYIEDTHKITCYLWAVFVESGDEYKSKGIAFNLMCHAANFAHSKGARTFISTFTAENAHKGKLVKNLIELGRGEYPDSVFNIYGRSGELIELKDD